MTGSAGRPRTGRCTDAWLIEKIKQIHEAKRRVYGAPRIHAELRMAHGDPCRAQARRAADAGRRDLRAGAQEARAHDDPRARREGR